MGDDERNQSRVVSDSNEYRRQPGLGKRIGRRRSVEMDLGQRASTFSPQVAKGTVRGGRGDKANCTVPGEARQENKPLAVVLGSVVSQSVSGTGQSRINESDL